MQLNTRPPAFSFPLDAATHIAADLISGVERLARLEMQITWDWFALGREQAAILLADSGAERDGWSALLERGSEAALRFNRAFVATTSQRQTELSRLAGQQTAVFQRSWLAGVLQSAPRSE